MACIEVTTRIGCPVACRYCPQQRLQDAYARRDGGRLLSPETFSACLGNIPAAVGLHFSGFGEPFSNPQCTDMILEAHRRGHAVLASTTLWGLERADVERLEAIPFAAFNLHLPSDGSGGERIDVDGAYLSLLSRLLASRLPVKLRFLGERLHPALDRWLGPRRRQHVRRHTRAGNLDPPPSPRRGPIGCRRDFRQSVLLPNGDVVLCCMDYGLRHVLGNLLTADYGALFRGDAFAAVRLGARQARSAILCRTCDDFAYRAQPLARFTYSLLRPAWRTLRRGQSKG